MPARRVIVSPQGGGAVISLAITPVPPVPDAAVGIPYEIQLISTGTGPWIWLKISGAGWFSMNASTGLGSGTPLAIEVDPIVVQVTDSLGATGTISL